MGSANDEERAIFPIKLDLSEFGLPAEIEVRLDQDLKKCCRMGFIYDQHITLFVERA